MIEADDLVAELVETTPKDIEIITYCDGSSCPSARELAEKILLAGHPNVSVFLGGMSAWLSARMPVSSGEIK